MESTLNTHPLALKYLIPSLIRIYVEVEQTGASSQFYDKFSACFKFAGFWMIADLLRFADTRSVECSKNEIGLSD